MTTNWARENVRLAKSHYKTDENMPLWNPWDEECCRQLPEQNNYEIKTQGTKHKTQMV